MSTVFPSFSSAPWPTRHQLCWFPADSCCYLGTMIRLSPRNPSSPGPAPFYRIEAVSITVSAGVFIVKNHTISCPPYFPPLIFKIPSHTTYFSHPPIYKTTTNSSPYNYPPTLSSDSPTFSILHSYCFPTQRLASFACPTTLPDIHRPAFPLYQLLSWESSSAVQLAPYQTYSPLSWHIQSPMYVTVG